MSGARSGGDVGAEGVTARALLRWAEVARRRPGPWRAGEFGGPWLAAWGSVPKPKCGGGGRLVIRAMSSARMAPVTVAMVCRRSWIPRSSRPAAAQALRHAACGVQHGRLEKAVRVAPPGREALRLRAAKASRGATAGSKRCAAARSRRHRRPSLAKRHLLVLYRRHGAGPHPPSPGRASGTCALPHPQHAQSKTTTTEPAASPRQAPPAQRSHPPDLCLRCLPGSRPCRPRHRVARHA